MRRMGMTTDGQVWGSTSRGCFVVGMVVAFSILGMFPVALIHDVVWAPLFADQEYCVLPEGSNLGRNLDRDAGDMLHLIPNEQVCPPCGVLIETHPRVLFGDGVTVTEVKSKMACSDRQLGGG